MQIGIFLWVIRAWTCLGFSLLPWGPLGHRNNHPGRIPARLHTRSSRPWALGAFIHLGQHLHGSRGYLNVVPAGPTTPLGPQGTQMEAVGMPEVTISLPLCCATEALRGFPCCSPQCPRRATIACQGGHHFQDPSPNVPPDGWNQPAPFDGGALYELDGVTAPYTTAPVEQFKVDLMDFEVSGPGELVAPARPAEWAPWEPRLAQGDTHSFETGCWVAQERLRRKEDLEFNFLIEFFYLIRDEICDRDYREWEEEHVRNTFLQVWNATPFLKEKTREAVPGRSFVHSTLPDRDAQAKLAAALEEGIVAATKQASLEIQAVGVPKVDSWLHSTRLCGPTTCPVLSGHGMYCPNDCSC